MKVGKDAETLKKVEACIQAKFKDFSVIAIVHTFFLNGAVTNMDHLEMCTLLYQLMVFWSTQLDKSDVDGGFQQLNSAP